MTSGRRFQRHHKVDARLDFNLPTLSGGMRNHKLNVFFQGRTFSNLRSCFCLSVGWQRLTAVLITALVICGCGDQDEIRRYRAPKLASLDSVSPSPAAHSRLDTSAPQRMLGAIVPIDGYAWFFRVNGDPDQLQAHVEPFKQWLSSIRFVDEKPTWQLPDGWRVLPPSGMRFATILLDPADEQLELTVIPLPIEGDPEPAILANINRWRGQVGLVAIESDQLSATSEAIPLEEMTATFVDLISEESAAAGPGMMSDRTSPKQPSVPAENSVGTRIDLDVPDGWEPASLVTSRGGITIRHEAAFEVVRSGQRLEFTLDRLPPAGSLLMNVNRWRAQIGLDPIPEDRLKEAVSRIEVGGVTADLIELIGDQETILGVIAVQEKQAWYFKLKGNNELAAEEKENFLSLARSVTFPEG